MWGDRLPDISYLKLIEAHCDFALEHCAVLEAAMNALREDDSRSPRYADAALIKVMPSTVGCLTHAALVSSFLFPTSCNEKEAQEPKFVHRDHLRSLLNVNIPTLEKRDTRNELIHMDERLDDFWSDWKGDSVTLSHDKRGQFIVSAQKTKAVLVLDHQRKTVEIFGKTVDLHKLNDDLKMVKTAIVLSYNIIDCSEYMPLWRKFRQFDMPGSGRR